MHSLPATLDLAIVGAGPHALTLVTHLLQKRAKLRGRFRVFDATGQWMQRWQAQFAAQEIEHLRSPAVHHPDPHPSALRNFAIGRAEQLYPPYDLPGTRLFNAFCQEVIERWQLQDCLLPHRVEQLDVQAGRYPFCLTLAAGRVEARRVILATGAGKPHWPAWAMRAQLEQALTAVPRDSLVHASQLDLRRIPSLNGEHLLIIGGGLSSGHLALGAIRRGASVTIMIRRHCREKRFDADPGWLGPKYLKGFGAERDWFKRWQMIQEARDGGSFTPEVLTQLRRLGREGKIRFLEHCQVTQASNQRGQWQVGYQVDCNDAAAPDPAEPLTCHRIWLATGHRLEAERHPLLQSIQQSHPTPYVNGLPVLDNHLRWPGLELFITGGLAALQLGPAARNLHGARMAAARIVPAIAKPSLARSGATTASGAAPGDAVQVHLRQGAHHQWDY